jgi:hypothetical protein
LREPVAGDLVCLHPGSGPGHERVQHEVCGGERVRLRVAAVDLLGGEHHEESVIIVCLRVAEVRRGVRTTLLTIQSSVVKAGQSAKRIRQRALNVLAHDLKAGDVSNRKQRAYVRD